jgi:hypothetical protein
MHLLVAGVLVADRQLLKLSSDVISGPGIHVPVSVHAVGGSSRCRSLLRGGGAVKLWLNLLKQR